MFPSSLDPTQLTALHSFTMPDVLSPDGRAHPLDASTPVTITETGIRPTVVPAGTTTGPQVPASGGPPIQIYVPGTGMVSIPGTNAVATANAIPSLPVHFGARTAVAILAIGILLIVIFRLST